MIHLWQKQLWASQTQPKNDPDVIWKTQATCGCTIAAIQARYVLCIRAHTGDSSATACVYTVQHLSDHQCYSFQNSLCRRLEVSEQALPLSKESLFRQQVFGPYCANALVLCLLLHRRHSCATSASAPVKPHTERCAASG